MVHVQQGEAGAVQLAKQAYMLDKGRRSSLVVFSLLEGERDGGRREALYTLYTWKHMYIKFHVESQVEAEKRSSMSDSKDSHNTMTRNIILLAVVSSLFAVVYGASKASVSSPPFVAHLDSDALKEALQIAKARHTECVQCAMANYPIDLSTPVDTELIDKMKLVESRIKAPGDLPDFSSDLERRVFVTETPLLTKEECQKVVADAEAHFGGGEWGQLDSGQYKVSGFWIKDVPSVHKWFNNVVASRLFPLLVKAFPDFCSSPEDLCVDNAYLFKYTPETGFRTNVHTDSGCLAFTIALNPSSDYEGGGTWFEGLNGDPEGAVIEMEEGQVTVRPGGVKHCGHAVHSGTRYIIGGFCMHKQKVEQVRQLLHSPPDTPDSTLRKTCEAAVALNPSTDLGYNLLANVYEKAGEVEKAQEVLEYCLEKVHPYSGDVAYALGSIYKDKKEYEKARTCFKTCLKCDKYDFDAMMAVVSMSAALGDKATEEEYCRLIVDKGGASSDIAGQAYCNLGVLYEGKDEEIGYYQKSIELKPAAFAPVYSLACAYATRQQWSLAAEQFKRSLSLEAQNEEEKFQALKNLYRCSCSVIQSDPAAGSMSQQDLLGRLQEMMGKENLDLLTQKTKGR